MNKKAETIKTRYGKGYVTEEQLTRYLELGVITQEEYHTIYVSKHTQTAETEEEIIG